MMSKIVIFYPFISSLPKTALFFTSALTHFCKHQNNHQAPPHNRPNLLPNPSKLRSKPVPTRSKPTIKTTHSSFETYLRTTTRLNLNFSLL